MVAAQSVELSVVSDRSSSTEGLVKEQQTVFVDQKPTGEELKTLVNDYNIPFDKRKRKLLKNVDCSFL